MLSEADMLSPWHDAENIKSFDLNDCGCPRLVLLLAAPRSGSYHLCRLLWNLGIGRPTEYFNPLHAHAWARFSTSWQISPQPTGQSFYAMLDRFQYHAIRRRLMPGFASRLPRAKSLNKSSLTHLIAARSSQSLLTNNFYFASKVQAGQLGSLANARRRVFLPQVRRGVLAPFDQKPPLLILLVRRYWQRALFSFHLSLCSGCFDYGFSYSYQHRSLSQLGRPSSLLEDLVSYRQHLDWLVQCLRTAVDPLQVVAYEDLVADQDATLYKLLNFLEPVDQMPEASIVKDRLNFRIHSDRSDPSWERRRRSCLLRIGDLFEAQGLGGHPEAERCRQLTEILVSAIG